MVKDRTDESQKRFGEMPRPLKREHVAHETPDMLAENLEAFRGLFPQAIVDGRIDVRRLRAVLGEIPEEGPDRYTFLWAGRRSAVQIIQMPSRATLLPFEKESVEFDTTRNLVIEGDNLEVLKLLYKPYFSRIKMIFIDPPYNTGRDFVYSDDYADPLDAYLKMTRQVDEQGTLLTTNVETGGRFHSA